VQAPEPVVEVINNEPDIANDLMEVNVVGVADMQTAEYVSEEAGDFMVGVGLEDEGLPG
jgi:hypothetical protein